MKVRLLSSAIKELSNIENQEKLKVNSLIITVGKTKTQQSIYLAELIATNKNKNIVWSKEYNQTTIEKGIAELHKEILLTQYWLASTNLKITKEYKTAKLSVHGK